MPAPYAFDLELAGPLDLPASLEIFRRSGDDLLDRWDGTWLVRTTSHRDRACPYACQITGTVEAPALRVHIADPADRDLVARAIRNAFVPLVPAFDHLCRIDPVIAWLARWHRGFRPVLQADLLTALVRCISAQQVNLKWASTVRRRLAETFGDRHCIGGHTVFSLAPDRIASLRPASVRALQFTTRKAEYVVSAARAVADGGLDLAALAALSDDEVIARVTAVRGLGLWTAEWILARTLGRPRVSAGDLGVRKAVGIAYMDGSMAAPDQVRAATSHWGGAAGLAQGLLLHAQHQKTLQAYRLNAAALDAYASVLAGLGQPA